VTSGEPLFSSINAAKPFGGRAPPGLAGRAHSAPSDPLAGCGGRFAAGGEGKREGREGKIGKEGWEGKVKEGKGREEGNGWEGRGGVGGEGRGGERLRKEGREGRKGKGGCRFSPPRTLNSPSAVWSRINTGSLYSLS
jgi:hypothetical protein